MQNRNERLAEALRAASAEFLVREALPPPHGALITVTRAEVAESGTRATIFMTVFPDTLEEAALKFANRSRHDFAEFFSTRVKGVVLPRIEFLIDRGEKNRQRLDELSN